MIDIEVSSSVVDDLESLNILSRHDLQHYFPRVRDRVDINVLIDHKSGVILLNSDKHIADGYYTDKEESGSIKVVDQVVKLSKLPDNERRFRAFKSLLSGKIWLDFGCGLGGMLDVASGVASEAVGLEPSLDRADITRSNGHRVVLSLDELSDDRFDVVTLFHVFEHLPTPMDYLQQLNRVLKPGGTLVLEVPHARDALINLYHCEAFKAYTFWSEHLVLHTKNSLITMLKAADFKISSIEGFQRYGLSNHLNWLSTGRPGKRDDWRTEFDQQLDTNYAKKLVALDATDTLIVMATK